MDTFTTEIILSLTGAGLGASLSGYAGYWIARWKNLKVMNTVCLTAAAGLPLALFMCLHRKQPKDNFENATAWYALVFGMGWVAVGFFLGYIGLFILGVGIMLVAYLVGITGTVMSWFGK